MSFFYPSFATELNLKQKRMSSETGPDDVISGVFPGSSTMISK